MSTLSMEKEIAGHPKADSNDEAPHQLWVQLPGIVGTSVATDHRSQNHQNSLWPRNNTGQHKSHYCQAVDATHQQYWLSRTFGVNGIILTG